MSDFCDKVMIILQKKVLVLFHKVILLQNVQVYNKKLLLFLQNNVRIFIYLFAIHERTSSPCCGEVLQSCLRQYAITFLMTSAQ